MNNRPMTPVNKVNILLVDDQRFVAIAVGRLLAGAQDIDLHCCSTASDAIQRANVCCSLWSS